VCGAGCGAQAADFFWPLGGGNHDFFFCNSDRGPLSIPAYRCILSTI